MSRSTLPIQLSGQVVSSTIPKEGDILMDIVRKMENDPELKFVGLQLSKSCNSGDNYMSSIKKANIAFQRTNGNSFQKNFLMKIQLSDENRKQVLNSEEIWANEEYMYKMLFPALEAASSSLPIAKFYFSDPSVIVMEDLTESGYVMVDRTVGMDLEQALVVMDRLALFHSASLAFQHKNGRVFDKFKSSHRHPYFEKETIEKTDPYICKAIEGAAEMIDDDSVVERDSIISFLRELSNSHGKLISKLQLPPTGDSAVLIHGDLWINNVLLLKDPASGKTIDAKFVDFQGARIGSAAMDVHHFVFTSVRPEIRRNSLTELLQHYHKSMIRYLQSHLSAENYINSFTYERFYDEFKHYKLYGILNAIILLPAITLDSKTCTFDFFNLDSNNNTNSFKERLLDVIDDYIKRDWLNFD